MAKTYGNEFNVGDRVIWPNGVPGIVQAIDESDDALMDECGAWHTAYDVEFDE